MNPTLQGYTAAVMEAAGDAALGDLVGDLEAVERVVDRDAQLRSALTDTTVRGAARRAVMLDLLDGKVSTEARRLAAYACAAVRAVDVPAALTWLANRTRHAAEGQAFEEPGLSLTGSRQRVGGFATAVFEDLSNDQLETVEEELFRFSRIVASTPALRSALGDRELAREARQGLVTQLLEGKVDAAALALVRYAAAGGRARDIVGTLNYLVEQAAKARGWRIATVRSAAPIEADQAASLSESLAALAGAPVELQVVIDEPLLSGALIQIGDLQVDATARGRLDALREHLVPGGWEDGGFGSRRARATSTTTETEGAS